MSQVDNVVEQGNSARYQSQPSRAHFALQLLLLSFLVIAFALIGIWSRPIGALAALWPANAVVLAYLARAGLARHVMPYLVVWLGFIAADVLTGSTMTIASLLTLGNLMSIGAGLVYLHLFSQGGINLTDRSSMLHIILMSFIASSAGGLMGMYAGPQLFSDTMLEGYLYWSVTEFVNYIAFLPVLFAMPASRLEWARSWHREISWRRSLPGLVTVALTLLVIQLNNLNALVLPLLGLLWCAFVYSTFSTALLTLFYCLQALLIVSGSYTGGADDLAAWIDLMLVRVSISAVALVPIVVSVYIQTTRSDVAHLSYSANHDHLTGALSRNAFMDVFQRMLVEAGGKQVTLFIMDLDHFKSINDEHGHPVGDAAIIHFLNVVQQCLRAGDAVGRIGGEEFAVAIAQKDQHEAEEIACRIHRALAELPLVLEEGERLPFTVSIGVASHHEPIDASDTSAASLSTSTALALFKQADEALYEAKANGRNQTVFSGRRSK